MNRRNNMRKHLILVIFIIVTFMAATLPAVGDSAEDYKVIKKAVKGKKTKGEATWFRIEVTEKKTKKSKVRIKIPVSLVELLSDCVPKDLDINGNKCNIDVKKIMKELKKHGPMTLIEVDEDDVLVKIWLE